MKIDRSKEWWMKKADTEGDSPVGAGMLARQDETGWLIEHRPGCAWWDGRSAVTFTPDPNDCVRFARKEDAERVLANVIAEHNREACIVTEHLWCTPRCTCGQNDSDTVAEFGDKWCPRHGER